MKRHAKGLVLTAVLTVVILCGSFAAVSKIGNLLPLYEEDKIETVEQKNTELFLVDDGTVKFWPWTEYSEQNRESLETNQRQRLLKSGLMEDLARRILKGLNLGENMPELQGQIEEIEGMEGKIVPYFDFLSGAISELPDADTLLDLFKAYQLKQGDYLAADRTVTLQSSQKEFRLRIILKYSGSGDFFLHSFVCSQVTEETLNGQEEQNGMDLIKEWVSALPKESPLSSYLMGELPADIGEIERILASLGKDDYKRLNYETVSYENELLVILFEFDVETDTASSRESMSPLMVLHYLPTEGRFTGFECLV